ncbi:MAG TPA: energy transducer TonB [Kofleriaceae bacterium]|nr:energy transducer TonB [Kofleriaceae bacterium]
MFPPRSRSRSLNLPLASTVAVVVHVGVLLAASAMTNGGRPAPPTPAATLLDEPADIELYESCGTDAALVAAARSALCFAPWQRSDVDTTACAAEVQKQWGRDNAECRVVPADTALSLMSPDATKKIKELDPEVLLAKPLAPAPKPVQLPVELAMQQPPPPPPPAPTRPMQIVETVNSNTDTEPDNTRFLSENNIKVDKQTVARGAVQEPMIAKPKAPELVATNDAREASMQKDPGNRPVGTSPKAPDAPGPLAMRTVGAKAPSETPQDAKTRGQIAGIDGRTGDGAAAKRGDGAITQAKREQSELAPGQSGAGGGVPRVPNLKPSAEVLERVAGGGSVDHLDDVEKGDETALNSKRWVHASFFNRVKRSVAQAWQPGVVFGRKYGNSASSDKTWPTEVRVTLRPNGSLADVVVLKGCGLAELDEEALRSFRVAGPFPNPPAELVKNGVIVFEFGFFFEVSGSRTIWRQL